MSHRVPASQAHFHFMHPKTGHLPTQESDRCNTQLSILHPESVSCNSTRTFSGSSAPAKKTSLRGTTSISTQPKLRAKRSAELKTSGFSFESLTESESMAILLYRDICACREGHRGGFPDELLLFSAFCGPPRREGKRQRAAGPHGVSSPALLQIFLQTRLLPVEEVRRNGHGAAVSVARWVAEHCYGCLARQGPSASHTVDGGRGEECGEEGKVPLMPRELLAEVLVMLARRGCLGAADAPTWLSIILFKVQEQIAAVAADALGDNSANPTAFWAAWQAKWAPTHSAAFVNPSQSVAWLGWRLSEDIVRTVYALQALSKDVDSARSGGETIKNSVSSLSTDSGLDIDRASHQSSWVFFSFQFFMHTLGIALHELGLLRNDEKTSLSLPVVPNAVTVDRKTSDELLVPQSTSDSKGPTAPITAETSALETKSYDDSCSSYWVDILLQTCFLIKHHEEFHLPSTSSQENALSFPLMGGGGKGEAFSRGGPKISQQMVGGSEEEKRISMLLNHRWCEFTRMVCSNIAKLRAHDVRTAILVDALLT
ncbi:unnamed protein product [Phytomonas sp. Hart1]|nr:unnamed protein product [Phytomonas sp. Hart1]|eukprot:CCW67321.1 unnamed protein product [Phytomonas sp. isolate Hart1]